MESSAALDASVCAGFAASDGETSCDSVRASSVRMLSTDALLHAPSPPTLDANNSVSALDLRDGLARFTDLLA